MKSNTARRALEHLDLAAQPNQLGPFVAGQALPLTRVDPIGEHRVAQRLL
jgi:hypothetical protein